MTTPSGGRFECQLDGQPMIGHVLDAATEDGRPAVLLWMGDESGTSVGPTVRARFSLVEIVSQAPAEIDALKALLRQQAVAQFKNMGWPAKLAELARKGITQTQDMVVTGGFKPRAA